MIEKTVYDYLKTELNVPVYMEIPANPAKEYVTIQKTAGGENNCIQSATLAIQSISSTLFKTATLNESVKDAMRVITQKTSVMGCKLNSDYNFTNTASKVYRYQAVFNLSY